MLQLLAILSFLAVQAAFNEFAPPQHLGWSIFYYSVMWLSLILICIENALKAYSHPQRKAFLLLTIPMFQQLSLHWICINTTYEYWYKTVDNRSFEVIFLILIIIISLYVILTSKRSWAKSLKKIGI